MMTWKSESMFTIDCSITSVVKNSTDGSSVPSIRAALQSKTGGSYTDRDGPLSQELAVSNVASCSLSIVSENVERETGSVVENGGDPVLHSHKPSAVMLKLADVSLPTDHATLPIDVAPLNAIKIKMCNLPSAWSIVDVAASNTTDTTTDTTTDSTMDAMTDSTEGEKTTDSDEAGVTLPTLKLNGKRITSQPLSAQAGTTCLTHAYRVPSVGLSSDGFVLSGSMLVNEAFKLGAGRASGVEISFGSVDSLGGRGGAIGAAD
jgi:hypothetical protein